MYVGANISNRCMKVYKICGAEHAEKQKGKARRAASVKSEIDSANRLLRSKIVRCIQLTQMIE